MWPTGYHHINDHHIKTNAPILLVCVCDCARAQHAAAVHQVVLILTLSSHGAHYYPQFSSPVRDDDDD